MKLRLLAGLSLFAVGACVTPVSVEVPDVATVPQSAEAALDLYYETIPGSSFPTAPVGKSLPDQSSTISRILVGSCLDEEKGPSEAMISIAKEDADLFLMLGDNVYGDRDGRAYSNNQPDLDELKESFADLAAREDFQAVRAKLPMMVAWDDHDYGANDAGKDFPFRRLAERIHETFWGLDAEEDVGQWPGTYYARSFGPEGKRVQVIMLDTRFFRSSLTPSDDYGTTGKERYMPAPAGSPQDMLGADQWTWLENELQEPADIRLIASSIQVMPTAHGWESWATMPDERARLFNLIKSTQAKGVVFLSGDRHSSFLYQEGGQLPYTATELTASSLNVSFATETKEKDPRQLGSGFPPENYGAVEIDWDAKTVHMELKDNTGRTVRKNSVAFANIGVN